MIGGDTYDAVVVGGGPAGLSAAGWLGRFRRRVLVIDSRQYRNRWVERLHGLYGQDEATPSDLRTRAQQDVSRYPDVTRVSAEVTAAGLDGERIVLTVDGAEVTARRVVLATGVRDAFPDVARFFDFYGSDVFHCPTCDGFEARDRAVVAIGSDPHVAGFALELLDWATQVRIVTDGKPLEIDDDQRQALARFGVEVVDDVAVGLLGERGDLRGLELASGAVAACSMAFFSIAHQPRTDLAEQLGCDLDEEGYLRVDRDGRTSVPGVYAAGDVTGGSQLVGIAVGEGTAAGVACAASLRGEPPLPGTPPSAPPPGSVMPDRS